MPWSVIPPCNASVRAADFVTVVRRIKMLGFNTVRLPFSMQNLFELPPRDWRCTCPYGGGRGNPTPAQLIASVTKSGINGGLSAPRPSSQPLPYLKPRVCRHYGVRVL